MNLFCSHLVLNAKTKYTELAHDLQTQCFYSHVVIIFFCEDLSRILFYFAKGSPIYCIPVLIYFLKRIISESLNFILIVIDNYESNEKTAKKIHNELTLNLAMFKV